MEELAVFACLTILAILDELANRNVEVAALVPIRAGSLDVVEASVDVLLARRGLFCSVVRNVLSDGGRLSTWGSNPSFSYFAFPFAIRFRRATWTSRSFTTAASTAARTSFLILGNLEESFRTMEYFLLVVQLPRMPSLEPGAGVATRLEALEELYRSFYAFSLRSLSNCCSTNSIGLT